MVNIVMQTGNRYARKTFSLSHEPPALQVGRLPSFKYSLIYFIKTVVLSSINFSGGAFMLRKVVKVQKFPPDRPCDSLTAGGGKKKIFRQKKNERCKHVIFFNNREKQVRRVLWNLRGSRPPHWPS